MPSKVLKQLLAISSFAENEKEEIKSSISFLLLLKKEVGTNKRFFVELTGLLSFCKCQDLLTIVTKFNEENPGWLSENSLPFQDRIPQSISASEPQISMCFRKVLLQISGFIGSEDLEIMIGVSPIPEYGKEKVKAGHDLFALMEKHGCIDESDTELLQEIFVLLELLKPLKLLDQYHQQRKFCSVCSSTPIVDSSLSLTAWLQSPTASSFWQPISMVAMFLYRACTNLVYSRDEPQESCDSIIHRNGNPI